MQRDGVNSTASYVTDRRVQDGIVDTQALPARDLVPTCDLRAVIGGCRVDDSACRRQAHIDATIVGDLERTPGESSMDAAAFDKLVDSATTTDNKTVGGPVYDPNDFRSYAERI